MFLFLLTIKSNTLHILATVICCVNSEIEYGKGIEVAFQNLRYVLAMLVSSNLSVVPNRIELMDCYFSFS